MFFDHVRALFGPLPSILCRTGTFIRVFCGSNMLVLSLIVTVTKFLLVCIFGSIPLMDDNYLSFTINIIVNIVIFLATMSKFYIEDRPNVAEVIDHFLFSCRLFVCLVETCLGYELFTRPVFALCMLGLAWPIVLDPPSLLTSIVICLFKNKHVF